MEIGERVATLETQIKVALEGVANFRDFQQDMRLFVARSDSRENERLAVEKDRAAQAALLSQHEEKKAQSVDRALKRIVAILTIGSILITAGTYVANLFSPEIRHWLHLKAITAVHTQEQSSQSTPTDAKIPYIPNH